MASLVGPTDQRSKIQTYNIAPTWTRLINTNMVFTFGGYVRHDGYNYYPSDNPFADLTPLQQESVAQNRTLTNAGALTYISYVKGIHNVKAGATYQQTFLTENDKFGIVDPNLIPSLDEVDAQGNPIPGSPVLRRQRCYRGSLHHAAAVRSDTRRNQLSLPWSHRRKTTCPLRSGHHHLAQLGVQPRHSRRSLQRPRHRPPGRATPRSGLQHQAHQHRLARVLCTHHGNTV